MRRANSVMLDGAPATEAQGLAAGGLRVALFSGNYNYTRDGANQALNRLVAHLEAAGAVVRVYSPTSPTPAFEPCGELISVPSICLPRRPDYRLALGLPRRIQRDVAAFRPSVLHLSAPDLLGLGAQRLARRLGVPLVASVHTRFETYLAYYGFGWLRPAAERYLRTFYAGCDRVLAPNAPAAEQLAEQGLASHVRLWGRGVDRVQFSPGQRDRAWRLAHGLADGDVAVLFLGRLVMEKGLDVLVRTLDRLVDGTPRIRPVVVGDGPARPWLQPRLPRAIFTGQLTGAALGRAVASSDILINPSLTESFGNATLEGMAAGLAVVCPRAPSTRQLVTDGVDGLLVSDPSPAAYAASIMRLVADPEDRRRLGQAARQTSEAYDWSTVCDAVIEVYRELGAASRPLKNAPLRRGAGHGRG